MADQQQQHRNNFNSYANGFNRRNDKGATRQMPSTPASVNNNNQKRRRTKNTNHGCHWMTPVQANKNTKNKNNGMSSNIKKKGNGPGMATVVCGQPNSASNPWTAIQQILYQENDRAHCNTMSVVKTTTTAGRLHAVLKDKKSIVASTVELRDTTPSPETKKKPMINGKVFYSKNIEHSQKELVQKMDKISLDGNESSPTSMDNTPSSLVSSGISTDMSLGSHDHSPIVINPTKYRQSRENLPILLSFVFIKPTMADTDPNYHLDEAKIDQLYRENQAFFQQKLAFCEKYKISEFNIGKLFSTTRYSMKFTVDFNFTELNESMFVQFLCELQEVMQRDKIKMDFSPTAISILCKEFKLATHLHPDFNVVMQEIGMGSLVNLDQFANHHLEHYPLGDSMETNKLRIKFENNKLNLDFYLNKNHFKLDISFQIIQRMVLQMPKRHEDAYYMFFDLAHSPLLTYLKKSEGWMRVNDYNVIRNCKGMQYDPKLLGMARSYAIKIPFSRGGKEGEKELAIFKNILYMAQQCKENNKIFSFYIAEVEPTKSKHSYEQILKEVKKMFRDRFDILYASLVLFSKSYRVADHILLEKDSSQPSWHGLKKFLQLIDEYSKENPKTVEECLYNLELQCREEIVNVECEFRSLMYDRLKFLKRNESQVVSKKKVKDKHDNHILVRRAVLTPSHLHFERPIPLMKSRFSKLSNAEYALRVTVLEDNFRKFNKNVSAQETRFLKETIEAHLTNGIEIGDRKYGFLGSSSSQMRENGVLMYAMDEQGHDADWIRNEAGDLRKFSKNSAKFVSRFGLIFSQAMYQFDLKQHDATTFITNDHLGDYKSIAKESGTVVKTLERYNFSDGAGVISESLARAITEKLNIAGGYMPSAFQIRIGGCKGMLTCFPVLQHQQSIILRDSMVKFSSPDSHLGILKYAYPRPVFLNRPLIMILDQVEVDPCVFYKLFAESTEKIARAFLNQFDALSLIMTYHNEHMHYMKLFRNGISMLQEPFFRRVLCYLAFYRLNQLKLKARIKVPEQNGRTAFGVVDETTSLEYGQVFFQYTEMDAEGNPTDRTHILEGEVMVTKFPCLQPGDIRKLKAVKIDNLSHLKDCIVFPARGKRPHPDEMGGSDLDGDEYAIFWNSTLIFPDDNRESMHFPSGNKVELDHDLKLSDIVRFYTEYLMNNNMGQVANAHLMYADFHPRGLNSDECVKLAIEYSISLDYQKTGVNCNLPKEYLFIHKSLRPDFMKKPGMGPHRSYLSKRILGQFYRQCCLVEEVITLAERFLNISNQLYSKPTAKLVLKGWKKFQLQAEEAFLEYKSRVIEMMEQLDVDSETMLLSDVYDDHSDIAAILLANLFADLQSKFESQAANLDLNERALLASAWYSICFEPSNLMKYTHRGQPLLGLPWTIPKEMLAILDFTKLYGEDVFEEEAQSQNDWVRLDLLKPTESSSVDLVGLDNRERAVLLTALKLIMTWITRVNEHIYDREFEVIQFSNNVRIKESEYMQDLVKNCLVQLYRKKECKVKKFESDRTLVRYLFNQFLLYLFSLCNSINEFIHSGDMFAQLLLVRYGVFALGFVNQIDKLFTIEQSDDQVTLSGDQPAAVAAATLLKWSEKDFDTLFDQFLINSYSAKSRVTETFFLLQPNTKLDLKSQLVGQNGSKTTRDFDRKICFLSGVCSVRIEYEQFDQANYRLYATFKGDKVKRTPVQRTHRFGKLEKRLDREENDVYYKVVTNGLPVSTRLLRILLGHPHFQDIYCKFQLCKG